MIKFLVLAMLLTSHAYATCLDAERVKNDIYSRYKIELLDAAKPIDLCNETSTPYHIFEALLFLQDFTDSAHPQKDAFNPQSLGNSPYQFFQSKVKTLVIDDREDSGDCSDGRVAFVAAGARLEDGIINICSSAGKMSTLLLSGILIHESRHLDGPQYVHSVCMSGPLASNFSCDSSYEEAGSYGVGTEYSIRVWRSESTNPALRAEARAQALMDFMERFNAKPFDLKEGALLLDESGASSFYDGEAQLPLPFALEAGAVPSIGQGLTTFFLPFKGKTVSNDFSGGLTEARSDVLTRKFNDEIGENERKSLKDVVYGSDYACLLLGSTLDCVDRARATFRKQITTFTPLRFLWTTKSRKVQPKMVHLVGDDGYLYFLPETAQELRAQAPEEWERTSSKFPYLYISSFTYGTEIGLTTQGEVQIFDLRKKTWAPGPGLGKVRYRFALTPFIWSERLRDL